MELTVCTGTFGGATWSHLARQRAFPSVVRERVPWVHEHRSTLAEARNAALDQVETEWVAFLDADDELEPGYVEAMAAGSADVRGPVARYIEAERERLWQPRVAGHYHDCGAECLPDGNWLLVGAAVRTELLRRVGGWREWPCYEDWDIFLRCHLAGASFELIPSAIYRAYVRRDSRNRAPSMEEKNRVHHEIVAANGPLEEAA